MSKTILTSGKCQEYKFKIKPIFEHKEGMICSKPIKYNLIIEINQSVTIELDEIFAQKITDIYNDLLKKENEPIAIPVREEFFLPKGSLGI